jgi:uncharacterized membrane protein (GlpM family)
MANQPATRNVMGTGMQGNPWPRYVNIIAGAWLFVSAFSWPHTAALRTNSWIVGALMFILAISSVGSPRTRYANTILAIWLFFSSIFMSSISSGTVWNNVIVAIVVFICSLIPSGAGSARPGAPAHG